jgi:hypothetical protein
MEFDETTPIEKRRKKKKPEVVDNFDDELSALEINDDGDAVDQTIEVEIQKDIAEISEDEKRDLTIDTLSNEFLVMCRSDREKADEIFDLFMKKLTDEKDFSQASKETLARAIEIKNTASANLIELLKIKAGLKKIDTAILINNNNGAGTATGSRVKGVDTNEILRKIKEKGK